MAEDKDLKSEETENIEEKAETAAEAAEKAGEADVAEEAAAAEETEEAAEAEIGETEEEPAVDEKDKKIAELDDRFRRLFAEFDNFRKRSESEKAGRYAEGEKTILLKVLPLIDNFERALAGVPEENREDSFVKGMELIYKSFTDELSASGVKPIEAVGQPFNADYHNAVMHVDDENQPDNTVVEEFQKGYLFGDKVLRYSMVKVAN